MDRIKKVFSLIHLGAWGLLFPFFCWVFWSEGHANWLYLAVTVILVSSSIFYSHFFVLTRYFNRKKYGLYFLGLALIFLLGPLPVVWAEEVEIKNWPAFLDQYFTSLLSVVIFFVVLSWMARATENWFLNTLKRENLEKQAVQAELSYLKWQINPHFLFNTLNNIHTLSYKQSPATPEAIRRLSALMRYMLYDANANTVSLRREIDYLQDFINLQQLRYKNMPVVDLEIAGDVDSCYIAPLLFIHLLENAYKHSPAQLNEGDIQVRIAVQGNTLTFSIQNPIGKKAAKTMEEPGGIGLINVRKRLQLLYPDQHALEISPSEETFRVEVRIHRLHFETHERKADLLYSG